MLHSPWVKVRTLYLSFFNASVICSLLRTLESGWPDGPDGTADSRGTSTDRGSDLRDVRSVDFQAKRGSNALAVNSRPQNVILQVSPEMHTSQRKRLRSNPKSRRAASPQRKFSILHDRLRSLMHIPPCLPFQLDSLRQHPIPGYHFRQPRTAGHPWCIEPFEEDGRSCQRRERRQGRRATWRL